MPDIDFVRSNVWTPLAEAPQLPDSVPVPPVLGGRPINWWTARASDGSRLYGAVTGDCGAAGPYIVAVWCLPTLMPAQGESRAPRAEGPARFPAFDEWAALIYSGCLPGVMFACAVMGAALEEIPPAGTVLVLTQSAIIGDTPAARRWALAQPGSLPGVGFPS